MRPPTRRRLSPTRFVPALVAGVLTLLSSGVPARGVLAAGGVEHGGARPKHFDTGRLARVDSLLHRLVRRGEIGGAVALVSLDGAIQYQASVGWLDVERRTPMPPDALFRVASMTKPITAVAILILMEEGALQLSDPIGTYIPELSNLRVLSEPGGNPRKTEPAASPITLRHLLTHTSGLSYGFTGEPLDSLYRAEGVATSLLPVEGTMADNLRRLSTLPLAHQPGTAWRYGVSYDVLGRVIEIVSGLTLPEFFRTRIFQPLGMTRSYFEVPPELEDRLAVAYTPASEGGLRRMGRHEQVGVVALGATGNIERPLRYFSGGGNVVSTAGDYTRFLEMLRRGGALKGVRILSPKTVELMLSNAISNLPEGGVTAGAGFGFGVEVLQDLGRWGSPGSVGTFRWGGIYGTSFWVDPEERMTAVLFFQRYPRGGIRAAERFSTAVYQALVE